MKWFLYIFFFLLFSGIPLENHSQHHPFCFRPTVDFSPYLSRTLSILHEGNERKKNELNVIVYGQSVSKQDWYKYLAEKIREKYPNTQLNIVNKSVGGFASQKLWKTTTYDILPFYPDLVIFHVFGSHYDYEKIVRMIRTRTTAEMLIFNDPWQGPDRWSDTMSYYLVPSFCEKYGVAMANVRDSWIKYLENNRKKPEDLRIDGVHLNDAGNRLLADLLFPFFELPAPAEKDPFGLTDTVYVEDTGNINLVFTGTRIDYIPLSPVEKPVSARIMLDGMPPSFQRDACHITRPNADSEKDWPWETGAVFYMVSAIPPLEEEWTIEVTETADSLKWFRFKLTGSLTGFDGYGLSSERFVSNSGRVVIEPEDWFMSEPFHRFGLDIGPGFTVKWRVNCILNDEMHIDDETERIILFQGIRNDRHTLQIRAYENLRLPGGKLVIYKPYMTEE